MRVLAWRSRLPAGAATLLGLVVVLLAVGVLALPLIDRDAVLTDLELGWPVLAAAAAVGGLLEQPARRGVHGLPTWEVVTVLALFYATPRDLVLGAVVGSAVVGLATRGPLRAVVAAATGLAESAVALQAFDLLSGPSAGTSPRQWLAAGAAVLVARAEGQWARRVADPSGRVTGSGFLRGLVASLAAVALGLVAVELLSYDLRTGWLLGGLLVALLVVRRQQEQLAERSVLADRLGGLERDLRGAHDRDEVLTRVLRATRDLLGSEHVSVDLVSVEEPELTARLDADGQLELTPAGDRDPLLSLDVATRGEPVLIRPGTAVPDQQAWLHAQRGQQGLLAPIQGRDRVLGTLCLTAPGERPLGPRDLELLVRIADTSAAALDAQGLVDRLRQQTLHDALTGLPNRVRFRQALSDALAGPATGLAVGVLDLDGFKDVNDLFGHAQGDLLLQLIGERLVVAVGTDGVVARLGGDEFALLLHGAGRADLRRVADRVLLAIREPVVLGGVEVEVGAGLGLSIAHEHGDDPGMLLKRADAAMYAAKGSASGVRIYDPQQHDEDPRHRALALDLPVALAEHRVQVHVLPVAGMVDGAIAGLEALLRWEHPELGAVPPAELLRIADRGGLTSALTAYVLEQALAGWASWHAAVGISVNLSARSLLDPGLPSQVQAVLERHEVPPGVLTLEVTEASLLPDPDRAMGGLLELRALGVRLSVDDFGTGSSTLSALTTLPVQEVKIDRSVVTSLRTRPGQAEVVRAIIDLARSLKVDVVAEGIEDAATWAELTGMGCARGQGWYLARPMPVEAVPAWLAAAERHSAPVDWVRST